MKITTRTAEGSGENQTGGKEVRTREKIMRRHGFNYGVCNSLLIIKKEGKEPRPCVNLSYSDKKKKKGDYISINFNILSIICQVKTNEMVTDLLQQKDQFH